MIRIFTVSRSELLAMMQLLGIALKNQPARRELQRRLGLDGSALEYYAGAALELARDLADAPEEEMPKVDINLTDYLDTASLLIALEVARVAPGDRLRRGAILQPMGMSENDADHIRLRLSSLMRAIQSTEKSPPGRDFPAPESDPNENAE